MTYRDRLAHRVLHPVVVQRTEKRADDLILHSWAKPVERVREARK